MLCYKDMCFCPFFDECEHGRDCYRAMTMDVIEKADECGLGIDRFLFKPDCFAERICCDPKDQIKDIEYGGLEAGRLEVESKREAPEGSKTQRGS